MATDRLEHVERELVTPVGQHPPRVVEREVLLIPLGRHTDPLGEGALKMRRRQADPGGQILKRQIRPGAVDLGNRAGDDAVMIGGRFHLWALVRHGVPLGSGGRIGGLPATRDPDFALSTPVRLARRAGLA